MSSTQDLCDGVATLTDAVRRYESARTVPGADVDAAWTQVRRAVGYMTAMVAYKEDMAAEEILGQGCVAETLDASWDMDARS